MDQDFYLLLIQRSLHSSLTEEETKQLATWRAASPENATLEAQTRKGWELSKQYDPELDVDVSAAFNKLSTRVRAHKSQTAKQGEATVRNLRRRLSIAAAVLVLIVAVWAIWPQSDAPSDLLYVELGPEDSSRTIEFPDGSTGWLQAGSSLRYPEKFTDEERRIELSGEAYFSVTKNASAHFLVTTDALTVEVLGTEFLVRAKPDEDVEVSVDEGIVSLTSAQNRLVLNAGERGRYEREIASLRQDTYSPNAAAWKTNTLVFIDQPLSQVVADLEAYAQVKISLEDPSLKDCLFSGRFRGDTPVATSESLLDSLADAFGLTWEATDNGYQLTGGHCR